MSTLRRRMYVDVTYRVSTNEYTTSSLRGGHHLEDHRPWACLHMVRAISIKAACVKAREECARSPHGAACHRIPPDPAYHDAAVITARQVQQRRQYDHEQEQERRWGKMIDE